MAVRSVGAGGTLQRSSAGLRPGVGHGRAESRVPYPLPVSSAGSEVRYHSMIDVLELPAMKILRSSLPVAGLPAAAGLRLAPRRTQLPVRSSWPSHRAQHRGVGSPMRTGAQLVSLATRKVR